MRLRLEQCDLLLEFNSMFLTKHIILNFIEKILKNLRFRIIAKNFNIERYKNKNFLNNSNSILHNI